MAPEVLEIRASGDPVATTLRTPGHDRELALGRLLALGLIESARDVATVTHCGRVGDDSRRNTIDVRAAPGFAFDLDRLEHYAALGAAFEQRDPAAEPQSAAILDASGQRLTRHEDVSLLNAIDKAIGAWLLEVELNAPRATPAVLVISGDVNEQIVQRAARAGIDRVRSALDLDR